MINADALKRKLDELAALPPGWDSYGSAPITPLAIERARQMLEHLHISPTSSGGLCLDMGPDFDVYINPDGTIATIEEEETKP